MSASVSDALPPEVCRRGDGIVQLAEDVRRDDEVGLTPRLRHVALDPARVGEQLAAGRLHLRLDLDQRQLGQGRPDLERRPGGHARPGADVEQRPWAPIGPLQRRPA